jgi:hypothetical protein
MKITRTAAIILIILLSAVDLSLTIYGIESGKAREANPLQLRNFEKFGYIGTFLINSLVLIFATTVYFYFARDDEVLKSGFIGVVAGAYSIIILLDLSVLGVLYT